MTKDNYRLRLDFDNGYGISVIKNEISYGLEIATLYKGEFTEVKGYTGEDGVGGYKTAEEVADAINHLRNL